MYHKIPQDSTRNSKILTMNQKEYLAIDYGTHKVGFAHSIMNIVLPIGISYSREALTDARSYLTSGKYSHVIYGLPLDQNGNHTLLCKKVEEFIKLLKKSHPHIIYIAEDERYTTQFAHFSMNEHNMSGEIDDVAASILLENYLSRN